MISAMISAVVEPAQAFQTTPRRLVLDNPIFLNIFLRQLNAFKTYLRWQKIERALHPA
jgi:hypothetical protein